MAPAIRALRTVLIVEDDPATREFYKRVLTNAGYKADGVEDGVDALRRIANDGPDVLILDLALPRLDGRDVQAELQSRAETRDIPIVVVTGNDANDLRGVASVIRKPATAEQLVAAVEKCLRQRR